jgi:hypothetical protein
MSGLGNWVPLKEAQRLRAGCPRSGGGGLPVCTGSDLENRKTKTENPLKDFSGFFLSVAIPVAEAGIPLIVQQQAPNYKFGVSSTEPNHHQLRQQEAGKQADDEIDRDVHAINNDVCDEAGRLLVLTPIAKPMNWMVRAVALLSSRKTEHIRVIHPRSLKTRGLSAVLRPRPGQPAASDKHDLRASQ